MPVEVTETEARVLGCLMEKSVTTPDYYPLTLNALTHACNQKSNRNPVLNLDEKNVVAGVDGLRDKKLAWLISPAGSKVPKYEHRFQEAFQTDEAEQALLCELLLRGPQTVGELRSHAGRLCDFASITAVSEVFQKLMSREPEPLVIELPRQPGRKEPRYMHLLCGPVDLSGQDTTAPEEPARVALQAETERIQALEDTLATVQEELAALRSEFTEFRQQFE